MTGEAFPVVYVSDVARAAAFYGRLGFEVTFRFPAEGDAGYVSMRRGSSTLGLVDGSSPRELIGVQAGDGPRFELFVYVPDVDAVTAELRGSGVPVLRPPEDMPWGERLAYVSDPDGNPVALAAPSVSPRR